MRPHYFGANGKGEQTQTGETFNRNYFQFFLSAFFNYKLNNSHALMLSIDRKILGL
ncbi:outer membrane beta-barrel protein [Mucilaginibacter sp. RCC_168]|uniref:outer membrane beta-barrel protein n=1 Tax=Mucilaginibacter sp. RCC_168 TaxID=3239221 RepID=UPI003525B79A